MDIDDECLDKTFNMKRLQFTFND